MTGKKTTIKMMNEDENRRTSYAAEKGSVAYDNPRCSGDNDDDEGSLCSETKSGSGGCEDGLVHQEIAQKETQQVWGLKLLVLLVLVSSTIAVAVAVYKLARKAQEDSLQSTFHDDVIKVFDSIGNTLDVTLGSVDALMVNIVSYAHDTNQSWPFVVVPDFAVRAEKIRELAQAYFLCIYPLVELSERAQWEDFTSKNNAWVQETIDLQANNPDYHGPILENYTNYDVIHGNEGPSNHSGPFLPIWQSTPVIPYYPPYNWDWMASWDTTDMQAVMDTQKAQITKPWMIVDPNDAKQKLDTEVAADWAKDYLEPGEDPMQPVSDIFYPILLNAVDNIRIYQDGYTMADYDNYAGFIDIGFYWRDLLRDVLPPGEDGVIVVFHNECSQTFTYRIDGPTIVYLGGIDAHEPRFDHMMEEAWLHELNKFSVRGSHYTGIPLNQDHCPTLLKVYPSTIMEANHIDNGPIILTMVAVAIFVFTSMVFCLYDLFVERRQKKVMKTAERSTAIVDSFFPSTVRDRLYQQEKKTDNKSSTKWPLARTDSSMMMIGGRADAGAINIMDDDASEAATRSIRSGGANNMSGGGGDAIADIFPACTVFFGDIAQFTSWSSERMPSQVFVLLENLYGAFDSLAKKHGVFKVETIGDCYVAVVGLPLPRKKHAEIAVKFGAACRDALDRITRELETTLGPGTSDLALRIGLHSGCVIAGVLRSDKARFQLFGDTVNTAARMESLGKPRRIHISEATAELIRKGGKNNWLMKRGDLVFAKGKGNMQTYWAEPYAETRTHTSESPSTDETLNVPDGTETSLERLVEWHVPIFRDALEKIVAKRNAIHPHRTYSSSKSISTSKQPRSEIQDVIELPPFQPTTWEQGELSAEVQLQLFQFVSAIARGYNNNNYFHSFEHSSHMVMSTHKLIARVHTFSTQEMTEEQLSRATYGITSDPLTVFAILFAALVHDVDHPGITNGRMIEEKSPLADKYDNLSIAEQHSIEFAWKLLFEKQFTELRLAIFATPEEQQRFRQTVVNCVMATDIFDPSLKEARALQWDRAFAKDNDNANLKATAVMEHIIQASDVSHTMQHWHVYRKWNERFFFECYHGFKEGRAAKDPSESWYKGELWFFDNYVIPLAKKLHEMKVFGGSCDELLTFATQNRNEWAEKGEEIVTEMLMSYKILEGSSIQMETSAPISPPADMIEGNGNSNVEGFGDFSV